MNKTIILIVLAIMTFGSLSAQKFFTREGTVLFSSEAPLEKIEAVNETVTAILDIETGNIQFAILIKGFQFEKALMQEHFNENYMESSKFPKAIFKGKIDDTGGVDWTKDGEYPVVVSGNMTIHGVAQEISTDGVLLIENGLINAQANFELTVADFDIEIPAIVGEKIAKVVEIFVDVNLKPF